LVTSIVQHQQEVEVATTQQRERAATETAAMVAKVVRLVMAELAVARAEVEATTVVDAARAAVAELEATCRYRVPGGPT
jgi:hypothetical protein